MLEGTVEECVWCFLLVVFYSKFFVLYGRKSGN